MPNRIQKSSHEITNLTHSGLFVHRATNHDTITSPDGKKVPLKDLLEVSLIDAKRPMILKKTNDSTTDAQDLKKLNLDDASAIGTTIQSDTQVKTEGKSSIKISTQSPTTICLGEVTGLDIENAKLVYKAKVKTDLEGTVFLEMWAHVGGKPFFSKGLNDIVKQKSDWKMIQTPFLFQKGQKPDKVTLNVVINGKGTVWIDDIVLSKEQ